MKYKLTYNVGKTVVQEWTFHSRSLAYWMKNELLFTGRFNDGKFKVKEI